MRHHLLFLVLLSGLPLFLAPTAHAAGKNRAAAKAADSDYEKIPAQKWSLTSKGFGMAFRNRNEEIEAAEPNRFFPASVAFALGRIDNDGHFLMLKCSSSSNECGAQRDMLEERIVNVSLLEVVLTPKAPKDLLYDARTWELTPLGYKYMEILRRRYPDLPTRLGRLVGSVLARNGDKRGH